MTEFYKWLANPDNPSLKKKEYLLFFNIKSIRENYWAILVVAPSVPYKYGVSFFDISGVYTWPLVKDEDTIKWLNNISFHKQSKRRYLLNIIRQV